MEDGVWLEPIRTNQMNKATPFCADRRKGKCQPLTDADRAALIEQATSPTTPPVQLLALSKLGDETLNSLIAANPNTPELTLHTLWRAHPLRALENPILLYWSLREGKQLRHLLSMDVKVALYLALRRNGSLDALEEHLPESERCDWLGGGPSDRQPNAPSDSTDRNTRRALLHGRVRKSVKVRVAKVHQILVTDPSDEVRTCLAENIDDIPLGPSERTHLQRLLAKDHCPRVRRGLASSTQIHGELHTQLSEDPEFEVRRTLASNPSRQAGARLEGWHNLITSGHAAEVAANPACPEAVKIALVSHGSPRERHLAWAGIRFHELTEWKPILEAFDSVFAAPERVTELVYLAKNQTIGGTLKSRLIAHADVRVTRAVATQQHLTEQQRIRLLFHADQKTALRAAKHAPAADYLDVGAEHSNPLVRALLAKKEGDKTWTLRSKLVDDPDPRVRAALCYGLRGGAPEYSHSAELHARVIQQYLNDPCPKVREIAARHPQFGRKRPRRR
jgi:hypothetical protein